MAKEKDSDGERIFKWACRACGIGGFLAMLASHELNTERIVMLCAFLWGPEILTGKTRLRLERVKDDDKAT